MAEWNIYFAAAKQRWLGYVDADDEDTALAAGGQAVRQATEQTDRYPEAVMPQGAVLVR